MSRAAAAERPDRPVDTWVDRQVAARADEGSLGSRALGLFVAPREVPVAIEPATAVAQFAARATVLGSPADGPPVAAALANALRARDRASSAAVAIWSPSAGRPLWTPPGRADAGADDASTTDLSPDRPPSSPATPGAARLASRLTARGLPCSSRGRLAWIRLPDDPVGASLAARRVAAALEVPLVIALAGPRIDPLEDLLAEQELVVIVAADPDGPLARLALAGLQTHAVACRPLSSGPARLLALAGLAGARVLGEPVRVAARTGR